MIHEGLWNRRWLALGFGVVLGMSVASAEALTISFEPATADTLIQPHNSTNYGGDSPLWYTSRYGVPMFKWDFSPLAWGTADTDATISFRTHGWSGQTTPTVGLYPILKPWDEGTVTWNNFINKNTSDSDFLDVYETIIDINNPASTGMVALPIGSYFSMTIKQEVIQGWIDDPSTNHGVAMFAPTGGMNVGIYAREVNNGFWEPRLTVTGTAGSPPVPEPLSAMLGLMGVGALGLARRRRAA